MISNYYKLRRADGLNEDLYVPRGYFIEENIYSGFDEIKEALDGTEYIENFSSNIKRIIRLKSNNLPVENFLDTEQGIWFAGGNSIRRFLLYECELRTNPWIFTTYHFVRKLIIQSGTCNIIKSTGIFTDVNSRIITPLLAKATDCFVEISPWYTCEMDVLELGTNGYTLTLDTTNLTGDVYDHSYRICENQLYNEYVSVRFLAKEFKYREIDNKCEIEIMLGVLL